MRYAGYQNPAEQLSPNCEICGGSADGQADNKGFEGSDCICPECPVCGVYADPDCYKKKHFQEIHHDHIPIGALAVVLLEEGPLMMKKLDRKRHPGCVNSAWRDRQSNAVWNIGGANVFPLDLATALANKELADNRPCPVCKRPMQ